MNSKLISFLLRASFVGLCASPAFIRASKERPVVGLSLDTLQQERWMRDRDSFVATVKKLGGEVLVRSAEFSDSQQAQDIDSMVAAGVDVIVIVAHNGRALSEPIKRANDRHIPVISYDRLIQGSDIAYYVATDNEKLGVLQAQYVADRLPKGRAARIIRIQGSKTDHNSQIIKDAQDKILNPLIASGSVVVLDEEWAEDWKPSAARRITTLELPKADNKVDAIICANDGTAGGAIEALADQGLAGKVIVTGQDAELPALLRIKEGTQSMTIFKPLDKLAAKAAEVAVQAAKGEPVTSNQTVDNEFKAVPAAFEDVVLVDKDNVLKVFAEVRTQNKGG